VLTFDPRFLTTQTAADVRLAVKVDQWHGPGLGDGQAISRAACYARTHVTGRVRRVRNRRTQVADDQGDQPLEGRSALSGGVSGGTTGRLPLISG
jgi:hypothetical protein